MLKKSFVIFLVLLLFSIPILTADDGSWNNSFSIHGGSIYSELDNREIVLEKELLVFDGKTTSVFFLFRNTADHKVTVPCGFPVRHEIQTIDCGDYLEIPSGPYGGGKIKSLDYLETRDLYDSENMDEPMFSLPEGILINDYNNSREYIDKEKVGGEVDFQIYQDGKEVSISKVLLERSVSRLGAAVIFHFRHDLVFNPGSYSVVIVRYSQDLVYGGDGMSTTYKWDYDIGTGGTWKGSIEDFLFILPSSWRGDPAGVEKLYENGSFRVYGLHDYEPERNETYSFFYNSFGYMEKYIYLDSTLPELKEMWKTGSSEVMQPHEPVQNFVTNCWASSSLSDRLDMFTQEGVIDRGGFGPEAAFDGMGETSWCEGVKGDGVGEYLEAEITEPIWAISFKNGFTRFPARDWMFEGDTFNEDIRDDSLGLKDYFSMNNRIKELEIAMDDGTVIYNLTLEDRRDPQAFTGIFLHPGRWRFIIKSVYPGTRWKDTCFGEISFFPRYGSTQLESFLSDPFFIGILEGVRF